MYWCKIARTDKEFDEIAKLNYKTFVEEIPQHLPNEHKRLVDRFHSENTYLLVYKNTEMVGMLAFRDQRPFSLDEKIGKVELFLEKEDSDKLCEIRLLAVKKEFRNGRVFNQLAKAIYSYVYDRGYTAAVISGIKREKKLYNQLGFHQFAEEVGTEDAKFFPMILTRKNASTMSERIRFKQHIFYPGPVEQEQSLTNTGTSHRSPAFFSLYSEMIGRLLELTNAKYVTTLVGTGTLANEVMLGQMKADFKKSKGLMITNGEFGERLIRQAKNWDLNYDICSYKWGESFNLLEIEQNLWTGNYRWICFVHGETSTGVCNDLSPIFHLAKKYDIKVCVDCISSFGSLPFSMEQLYLATAVSGKSLGAISGLAFVFSNEIPQKNNAPLYVNLAHYFNNFLPSTMPAYMVANLVLKLKEYPERFELLKARMELLLKSPFSQYSIGQTTTYPMIITMKLPQELQYFSDDAKLNGLLLHDESKYLKKHELSQVSVISLNFETAFEKLKVLYESYLEIASLDMPYYQK